MAKKNKRQMNRRTVSSPSKLTPRTGEFNPDYSDIKRDLRRIGTLAGTFIAILVILSFFLR